MRDILEHIRPWFAAGERFALARQRYGITSDDAFDVGLTCGGTIEILIQPVDPLSFPDFDDLAASISSTPVAITTVVSPGERLGARMIIWPDLVTGGLDDPFLDAAVVEDAVAMVEQGTTGIRRYGRRGRPSPGSGNSSATG